MVGEAGKGKNERCPTKRQGRVELLKKDSGQQNVSFTLHFIVCKCKWS